MEANLQQLRSRVLEILEQSSFRLSAAEMGSIQINDFGLSNLPLEGFAFVDLLRTERIRTTVMILLPHQTIPQHKHPPYDNEAGKEESVRVLWGQFSVCVEGPATPGMEDRIPEGKAAYYTARKEECLKPCMQYIIPPDTAHWFQAGPEGAVVLVCQNRVDEDRNHFFDPASNGCPIPAEPVR